MRLPNGPLSRLAARNVESVQAEIAQEKAAALSRIEVYLRMGPASGIRSGGAPSG